MKSIRLVLIVLVFWSGVSSAGECSASDTRCSKLSKLVNLLGYETSTKTMMQSCLDQAEGFQPELMIRQRPKLFKDVSEKSAQWSKVISAYKDYVHEFCDEGIRTAVLGAYKAAWDKHLTNEQLDQVLVFLNTSDGKAFADAFPLVYEDVITSASPVIKEIGKKAYLNYSRKIAEIADGK